MYKIKEPNKNKFILIVLEIILICTASIDSFFRDIASINFLTIIIGLMFSILLFYMRFEPDNKRYLYDAMCTITIIVASYYIVVYLLGLITGFHKNLNSLELFNIFKNVVQVGLYIIVSEMFRYMVVTKGKNNKIILCLLVLGLSLCDISDLIYKCNFKDISDTIDLVGYYGVPSIMKNIALTYISFKVSYKPSIYYRLVMELPNYFLPIFPSTGIYLQTIFNIILPAILFSYFYFSFRKSKNNIALSSRAKVLRITIQVILSVLTVCVVTLVSGFFKYHLIVVGSGSMAPSICKGDAIIVKKLSLNEINNLKVGNTLVFRNSNIVMIHRIFKILDVDGKRGFRTKGDYNASEDNFITFSESVIGTAKLKIPWIGIPTVWLKELANF